MVDPVAGSSLGLPVVNQVRIVVSKWFTRKDLAEYVFLQLGRVQRLSEDLQVQTPRVEQLLEHDDEGRDQLRFLIREVEKNFEELSAWEPKSHEARRKQRMRRTKQILDPCEQSLNSLMVFVMDESRPDLYMPANTVPLNPPRLLLDYNDPSTSEGQLKAAVLKDARRVVGILGSGKVGIGTTCTIRGLAEDAEINERFGGGILYVQLGNDATIMSINGGLAFIVESTGGKKLSLKVKYYRTLSEACNEAAYWFRDQACLFLIDDICESNDVDSSLLPILASMVNSKSRFVYTTRDKHFLSPAHEVITFEGIEPGSEQSRKMLLLHGGFTEIGELDEKNRTAFEKILVECKGLPLAFGLVGAAVHRLRGRQEEGREQDAWSDVGEMVSYPEQSILPRENAEPYGVLNRMVDISLQVLEIEYRTEKYRTMFRALCVFKNHQRAPVAVLRSLWSLGSLEEAKRAAEVLDEVSVLQLRKHNGVLCVQLHDLVMGIARERAEKAGETRNFHRTLLRNYSVDGKYRFDRDDRYVIENMGRHTACAYSVRVVMIG